MELAGRHIVVTGGASGIGRALRAALRRRGRARVVVADLDAATARGGRPRRSAGSRVPADVGREADIRGAGRARPRRRYGPIDLFFSNAGITGPSGGPETPDDGLGPASGAST